MSPARPKITVVIPLYNQGADVGRALDSVLAQTFPDFEIVVVDDGSTDEGPEVVKQFDDPRIRVIRQENSGVSAARNHGIAEARASVVAFLDADDEWRRFFLEEIARLRAAYPSAGVFATAYDFCNGAGICRAPVVRGVPGHPWDGILENYFAIASRSDAPLWTSALAVSKAAIDSIGGFPVGVKNGEDLLTWARLSAKHPIAYSTRRCALFRQPLYVEHRPGRYEDGVDVVGQELAHLLGEVGDSRKVSLRRYVAAWHKMNASIFLQLGNRSRALSEIRESVRLAGITPKLFIYRMVAALPSPISKRSIRWMIKGQRLLRILSRGLRFNQHPELKRAYRDVTEMFAGRARETLRFENEGKHLYELKHMVPRCQTGTRVLDVGGGLGVNLLVVSRLGLGCELHLIDRFVEYDESNRMGSADHGIGLLRDAGVSAVTQDLLVEPKLPYDDGEFDLVTCFDVLEHWPTHPLGLLSEIRRVLRENGTLILGVPNAVSLANRVKALLGKHPYMPFEEWCTGIYYGHYREYTPQECKLLLQRAGFQDVQVKTIAEPSRTMARHGFWKRRRRGWSPQDTLIRLGLRLKLWIENVLPGLRQTTYCLGKPSPGQRGANGGAVASATRGRPGQSEWEA